MIGLLVLTAIPTVTGVAQGVSQQRAQNAAKDDERRMAKFFLHADCSETKTSGRARKEIQGSRVVMRDGKLYLSSKTCSPTSAKPAYTLRAFYIEYPDEARKPAPLGLVSQVEDNPPLLNWIYVDKDTMEVRHGNRSKSITQHVGPWDWTEGDELGMTFEGWEGFVAVKEEGEGGEWAIYFDRGDDGLKGLGGGNGKRRKVEISLQRRLCGDDEKD